MTQELRDDAPRGSLAQRVLRLCGGLSATAGVLGWVGLAWTAITDLDGVTPQSDKGGRLMTWALAGTLLMILGGILLHFAQAGDKRGSEQELPPR